MRTGGVVNSQNFDTHVTKLDNGLTVASEKLFGEFCTVGVIINAGPRYESTFVNGTTHFLEKLSFNVSYLKKIFNHITLSTLSILPNITNSLSFSSSPLDSIYAFILVISNKCSLREHQL